MLKTSPNRLPKLRSTALTELYVQDRNGVAHADSARLVDDEQRKLSGNIRKVEPLITSHKVDLQFHTVRPNVMKLYPYVLEVDQQTVLACPTSHESQKKIS